MNPFPQSIVHTKINLVANSASLTETTVIAWIFHWDQKGFKIAKRNAESWACFNLMNA